LASLADAPVTVGHPGVVTAESWKADSVGHVRDVQQDGRFVASQLIVQDSKAVSRVMSKTDDRLTEISCGYQCTVIPEQGVFEGERYDSRQTAIRYNHVALGPKDWGRAGNDVKIKLDSGEEVCIGTCFIPAMTLDEALALIKVQQDNLASLKSDSDKTAAERDTLKVENDKLRATTDALKADSSEEKFASRVDARVALLEGVRQVLGEVDKTKSDAELTMVVLTKHDSKFDPKGKSQDYLRARFDAVIEQYAKGQSSLARVAENFGNAFAQDASGANESLTEKATREFKEKQANAWKVSK